MVVGFLACYIPMTVGNNTFVSFSGSINISSDITGGLYGEYEITTENPTKSQLVDSMARIKEVLEEDGYKNVNVYALGTKKIRVEVSYPKGSKTYASVYSELSNIASGAFELRDASSDATIILSGAEHVTDVNVYTNNDTKYIQIVFNDAGSELYKSLVSSGTIYLALGDYSQSISVSSVSTYESLTLSDTDYSNLVALEQKIKLGCMKIELDSDTATINTMSASLTAGESASRPEYASFETSTAFVVAVSALLIVFALGIAVFAVKFGLYAIVVLLTLLFNSYLFVILMTLMPSIELGLSGISAIVLGVSLIYTYAFMFASRVKEEYNQGKSLSASLENSFKKTTPNLLIGNITLFLMSLIIYAFSFGEISSAAIIFAICTALSLFTNLALIPFIIKICISFDGFGRKLFMLKKHDDSVETTEIDDNDVVVSKEAE
jgi:hypothetical protein